MTCVLRGHRVLDFGAVTFDHLVIRCPRLSGMTYVVFPGILENPLHDAGANAEFPADLSARTAGLGHRFRQYFGDPL
jgi:hypothetical protein